MTLPNFLHIGPGKSGSTWLHETLMRHPEAYLTAAKDLYFFSRYYHRGAEWYAGHFRDAQLEPVVGEVCPEYLSYEPAAARIQSTLGDGVRLAVTLRDPADRAFSSYLYLSKHGLARDSFRDTLLHDPELVDEGRYGSHLSRYAEVFGTSSIKISVFDDLKASPQAFYNDITDWLDLSRQTLTSEQSVAVLPASRARWLPLATTAQRGAEWVRRHDGAAFVGKVKRSPVVQRLLYQPLGDRSPQLAPEDRDVLRETLFEEIAEVDRQFGTSLLQTWGWE